MHIISNYRQAEKFAYHIIARFLRNKKKALSYYYFLKIFQI